MPLRPLRGRPPCRRARACCSPQPMPPAWPPPSGGPRGCAGDCEQGDVLLAPAELHGQGPAAAPAQGWGGAGEGQGRRGGEGGGGPEGAGGWAGRDGGSALGTLHGTRAHTRIHQRAVSPNALAAWLLLLLLAACQDYPKWFDTDHWQLLGEFTAANRKGEQTFELPYKPNIRCARVQACACAELRHPLSAHVSTLCAPVVAAHGRLLVLGTALTPVRTPAGTCCCSSTRTTGPRRCARSTPSAPWASQQPRCAAQSSRPVWRLTQCPAAVWPCPALPFSYASMCMRHLALPPRPPADMSPVSRTPRSSCTRPCSYSALPLCPSAAGAGVRGVTLLAPTPYGPGTPGPRAPAPA